MEQIKYFLAVVLLFVLCFSLNAQEEENIIKKGLLRTQLTFSPSYLLPQNKTDFYLYGNLEYYLEDKVSLSGDAYYSFFDTNNTIFDFNHNLFFGVNYHLINKKNHDFHIGFQPGIALTRLNAKENNLSNSKMGVNPVFSTVIGYNYYVHKFFHFFIHSRFVYGEHGIDLQKNISDFRLAAGLGLNINTLKRK